MRLITPLLLSLALSCTLAACGDDGGGGSSTSNGTSSTSNGTSATSNGTSGTSNGSSSTSNGTSSTTGGYDFPEGIQGDDFTSGPGFEVRVCEARVESDRRWIYEYTDDLVTLTMLDFLDEPQLVIQVTLDDGIPRRIKQQNPRDPSPVGETVLTWEELGGDNWVNVTDLHGRIARYGDALPYLPYNGKIAQIWRSFSQDPGTFHLDEGGDFPPMPDIEPPPGGSGSCLSCSKNSESRANPEPYACTWRQ